MNVDSSLDEGTKADRERSREELLAQVELLAEENKQLRDSYTQAKRTQYQKTATGLALLGAFAVVGSFYVQSIRDVLVILGGIGLFSGLLTYYITPEQFVSADVGQATYRALADNEAALIEELGLSDTYIYVPTSAGDGVRLFVPRDEAKPLPSVESLNQTVVVPDDSTAGGVALNPSGIRLFKSFEESLAGSASTTPDVLADQLADAVVRQFELAQTVTTDINRESDRLTVEIAGSAYGPINEFDHPVASLFATGFAYMIGCPVSLAVTESPDTRSEYIFTCRWEGYNLPED